MKVQYYSDALKKYFDDETSCMAAEREYEEKHAAELKAKEERAARAKEVEAKFKKASEAYEEANKALKEFCSEYGSFHTTIQNPISTDSLFDIFFNGFF